MLMNAFFRRQMGLSGLGEADWLNPNSAGPGGGIVCAGGGGGDGAQQIYLTRDEYALYNSCGGGPSDPRWNGVSNCSGAMDCVMEKKFLIENAIKIRQQNEAVMQQQQQLIAQQLEQDRQRQQALLEQQAKAAQAAIAQAQALQQQAQQAAAAAQQQATEASAQLAAQLKEAAEKAAREAAAAIAAHNQTAQNSAQGSSGGTYEIGSGEDQAGSVIVDNGNTGIVPPASQDKGGLGLLLAIGAAVVLGS